jgi:hypothetical protein
VGTGSITLFSLFVDVTSHKVTRRKRESVDS